MNAWGFFASIIGSLAWPAAIVTVVFIFRAQIKALGTRLTSLRYGSVEIDFGKTLERVEEAVSRETIERGEITRKVVPTALENSAERFERLAELSPAAAVQEAWLDVESMLRTMAAHHGIDNERTRAPAYLINAMARKRVIDARTTGILNDMRNLRNAAAHGQGLAWDLTKEDALRFGEMADEVVRILAPSAD